MMPRDQIEQMMKQPGMPAAGGGAMPMPVDSLTPDSGLRDIRTAISQSIKQCMKEGKGDQKQCAGMAYGIARERTGQELKEGTIR